MKKSKKDTAKGLPTDFGALGKLLDDAFIDLPDKFDGLLDSVKGGFKKFLSPPLY